MCFFKVLDFHLGQPTLLLAPRVKTARFGSVFARSDVRYLHSVRCEVSKVDPAKRLVFNNTFFSISLSPAACMTETSKEYVRISI
jgi:hypothetical protein